MATGTDAKGTHSDTSPRDELATHSGVSTYGAGTHTETDTPAGRDAKSGTEARHEHARTHRHDEQRCTQRDRRTRTRRFLQRRGQTIQNQKHAAAHIYTKVYIQTHLPRDRCVRTPHLQN